MKRNLTFAVIGLTLGLVSGFKASNYNYRADLNAKKMAGINAAGTGAGGTQAAMAQVQQVVARARQEPANLEAQHEAAHMFVQINRPDGAIEFLQKAQQLKPDDADTMAELAESYYLTQRFDDAISWARRALVAKPGLPIANYYLMASYVETNTNLDEAARILDELEKFKPGDKALAQIREVIQKGRAETGKKSVLSHGPEEAKGGKQP
jgi:tetratricopeptide (TPR) repeat protein